MASQAQLTSNLRAIDSALAVLRQQFATVQPGSTAQTQLSIQIFDLEQRAAAVRVELARLQQANNPPNPQVPPAPPAVPVPVSEVQTAPENPQFVFDENGELVPADSAQAQQLLIEQTRPQSIEPVAPPRNLVAEFDADTQSWGVWDNDEGRFLVTGLSKPEAEAAAQGRNLISELDAELDAAAASFEQTTAVAGDPEAAAAEAAIRERARVQAVLANQQRQADAGDWRFKIRLAPGAKYLYRGDDGEGSNAGILAPLAATDGVIFPYTPTITTAYRARYNEQDLPHSNYKGYFYSGSHVDEINVQSIFTAQDTNEANYMLAVIHFFRSVTKMFYGQDDNFRGAPPPLVFLQGLGTYQFNRHPCVVTSFNYNLPADVDYIRADVQPISGLNIQQDRRPGGAPRQSLPTNVFTGALSRLRNAGLAKGGKFIPPTPDTLGTITPTYVPTKIEMTIVLLPMQTRRQVSQEFSLGKFANGDLLKKGFW